MAGDEPEDSEVAMRELKTEPKGLLVPAWRGRDDELRVAVVFERGEYQGMTVTEVAKQLGIRVDRVRWAALKGICPSTLDRPGRGAALRKFK